MAQIEDWRSSADTQHLDDRDRMVYGVGTAAFVALAQMLGVYHESELQNFRRFMIDTAANAAKDVSSSTNLESHDIPIDLFTYEFLVCIWIYSFSLD